MRRKVVILLSDKRSGSTMLETELSKHPEIQHVAYSPHTFNETHHWLKGAVILGLDARTYSGGKVYPGYGGKSGARTYMIDLLTKNIPNYVPPRESDKLVFEGWEALCDQFAEPVFFEKSPQLLAHWGAISLMLEWMQRTEFEVYFVGLTRNPLAVMRSARNLFHTSPEQRQFGWLKIQRNLLAIEAIVGPSAFMRVSYEDIVAAPRETLSKIFDFIGIAPSPMVGSGVKGSILAWKEDRSFTLELDPTVLRMAYHFGYCESDLSNSGKAKGSNRSWHLRVRGVIVRVLAHIRDRFVTPWSLARRRRP